MPAVEVGGKQSMGGNVAFDNGFLAYRALQLYLLSYNIVDNVGVLDIED